MPFIPVVNPFVGLIITLIDLYLAVVWAWFILSWLIALNIVNRHLPLVQKVNQALTKLTAPPLTRIRKYMPDLGSIDISPIVLIIGLHFLEQLIVYYSLRL